MGLRLQPGHGLTAEAQGDGGMVRMGAEIPVVVTAAVTDAVAAVVKDQTGHDHQSLLVTGNGSIFCRLRCAEGAGPDLRQVGYADKAHFPSIAFGKCDLLPVKEGLLHQQCGIHFFAEGKIAVQAPGLAVGIGFQHTAAKCLAFLRNVPGGCPAGRASTY